VGAVRGRKKKRKEGPLHRVYEPATSVKKKAASTSLGQQREREGAASIRTKQLPSLYKPKKKKLDPGIDLHLKTGKRQSFTMEKKEIALG